MSLHLPPLAQSNPQFGQRLIGTVVERTEQAASGAKLPP
jgi:hypothetical protein